MTRLHAVPAVHEHYGEVDVTDWPVVGDEALGTKPKRWLKDPQDGHRWLMKDCTYSQRNDGTRYRKGDDWSERIANGVAQRLGLPAAPTELAVRRIGDTRVHGVISKSVVREREDGTIEEDLVDGNQLLPVPVAGGDRSAYTIASVREALMGVEAPAGIDGSHTAWDVFIGYLILDAVVGNTDRHEENWAVIDRTGQRSLAPSFDHASCLGFQLDDERRKRHLSTRDHGFTPEAYADRAKSPFAGRPHPIDVVVEAMAMAQERAGRLWIGRYEDVGTLLEPVRLVPAGRMSQVARDFAERVIRRNCYQLLAKIH